EADPGAPGDLRPGFGHVGGAAVLARDDQADSLARVVEGVEHREIALARNAERGIDAVDFQRIDENLRRGPRGEHSCHRSAVSQKGETIPQDSIESRAWSTTFPACAASSRRARSSRSSAFRATGSGRATSRRN